MIDAAGQLQWLKKLQESSQNDWRVAEYIENHVRSGVWVIRLGEVRVSEVLSEVT